MNFRNSRKKVSANEGRPSLAKSDGRLVTAGRSIWTISLVFLTLILLTVAMAYTVRGLISGFDMSREPDEIRAQR